MTQTTQTDLTIRMRASFLDFSPSVECVGSMRRSSSVPDLALTSTQNGTCYADLYLETLQTRAESLQAQHAQAKTCDSQAPSEALTDDAEEFTTVMFCNIPCKMMVKDIANVIDKLGLAGTYTLVYLPAQTTTLAKSRGTKKANNRGFAFINFKDHESAKAFVPASHNYKFPGSKSLKVSFAKPAHHQGHAANVLLHSSKGDDSPGWLLDLIGDASTE